MGGSSTAPGPAFLAPNPGHTAASPSSLLFANLPPDQRKRVQEDMADRERQASALAAAGMVAESVNYTKPIGQVMPAAPPLVGIPPPSQPSPDGQIPLDTMNWNDLGGNMDDIDMDFAAMFDPEQEQERVFLQDPVLQVPSLPDNGQPSAAVTTVKTEEHGIPNPLNASS